MLNFKRLALGVAFAAIVAMAMAPSAKADDRNGRGDDRDWRGHEMHARDWHRGHPHYDPHVIYAPPVVYAPPPPMPVSSGINLIVPLNFR
jgi:hypothetical protein